MATGARIKHCSLCQNHGEVHLKRKHACKFEKCVCYFCDLTRMCQKAMRHQQRLWRHQKQALKKHTQKIKGQACDKCRNHDIIVEKKNHICPRSDCECKLCDLNNTRKVLLKHQQRVRRAKVISERLVESREETNDNSRQSSNNGEDGESTNSTPSMDEMGQNMLKTNSPLSRQEIVTPEDKCSEGWSSPQDDRSSMLSLHHEERPIVHRHLESPPPLIPITFCQSPQIESPLPQYAQAYPNSSKQPHPFECSGNHFECQFAPIQLDRNQSSLVTSRNQERNSFPGSPRIPLNYEEFSRRNHDEARRQYDYLPFTRYTDYHIIQLQGEGASGPYGVHRPNLEAMPSSSRAAMHPREPSLQTGSSFENVSTLRDSLENVASNLHQ